METKEQKGTRGKQGESIKQTRVAAGQQTNLPPVTGLLSVTNWISSVLLLPFQPSCTFCCVVIFKENWQPQVSFRE